MKHAAALSMLFSVLLFSSLVFAQQYGAVRSSCTYDYECVQEASCVSFTCQPSQENGFSSGFFVLESVSSSERVGSVPGYAPMTPPPRVVNLLAVASAFAVVLILIAGYGLVFFKPRDAKN